MKILIFGTFLALTLAYPKLDYKSESEDDLGTTSTNCSCGWTNKRRVVGGEESLKNEFPLMAGIFNYNQKIVDCGATILTTQHALSAAHCTIKYDAEEIGLLVGGHDYTKDDELSQILPILTTIPHEEYNSSGQNYDIAVIFLKNPMTFNQFIGPACLPNQKIDLVNERVKVLGWGRMENGKISNVLQKVDLKVLPISECKKNYNLEVNNPFQICTSADAKDSCQGDSGGPLLWLDPQTNRYTLVGIVSFGKGCGTTPGVNVEVAAFLGWIQKHVSYIISFHTDYAVATKSNLKTCSKQ